MRRRSVDTYALFWLAGIGFLWWPAIMATTLVAGRGRSRSPVALWVTTGCLALSLGLATALEASPSRLVSAIVNLSVWISLCALVVRKRDDLSIAGAIRGVVDLAAFQGLLVAIARLTYPSLNGITLPFARFLPKSIANDPNVLAFSTVRLAFLDYYKKPVIRAGGIFGTPTWAGGLAAIAILLLVFAGHSLGPWVRRPLVRVPLIALIAVTLYLSYARVDVLAMLVAAGAIVAMKARRVMHPSVWFSIACLWIGGIVAVVPLLPLSAWFTEFNNARQGSLVARDDIYTHTLKAILAAPTPLLGAGIKPRVSGLVASLGTHSTYLGLAYRGGVVCATAFVVLLVALAVRSLNHDAEVAFGLTCFLLVWCLTDDIDAGNLMPLALFIAYACIALAQDPRLSGTGLTHLVRRRRSVDDEAEDPLALDPLALGHRATPIVAVEKDQDLRATNS